MLKPLHLAIGVFDGVHNGHRYLIGEAIRNARATHAWAGALTFHPHPKKILHLADAPQLIYPIQQRYWLLKKLGCDYVFIKKFTEAWSQYLPEKFFAYLKRLFPNLKGLYVGEDFHFGHNRCGDTTTLNQLCQKDGTIELQVFKHLKFANERICSSRIRQVLLKGFIEEANALLGLPYQCIGYVDEHYIFKHHCELIPKDGYYNCTLKNKQFQQSVNLHIQSQQMHLELLPQSLLKKACILEFKSTY